MKFPALFILNYTSQKIFSWIYSTIYPSRATWYAHNSEELHMSENLLLEHLFAKVLVIVNIMYGSLLKNTGADIYYLPPIHVGD